MLGDSCTFYVKGKTFAAGKRAASCLCSISQAERQPPGTHLQEQDFTVQLQRLHIHHSTAAPCKAPTLNQPRIARHGAFCSLSSNFAEAHESLQPQLTNALKQKKQKDLVIFFFSPRICQTQLEGSGYYLANSESVLLSRLSFSPSSQQNRKKLKKDIKPEKDIPKIFA